MTAIHAEAATFVMLHLAREARVHSLSAAILRHCDLTKGDFRWTVQPTIGRDGDWADGEPLVDHAFDSDALRWLLGTLVRGHAVAVLEWAIILPPDSPLGDFRQTQGIRELFKEGPSGIETFYLLEPSPPPSAVDAAAGMAGGAHYEVGVVTSAEETDLPPNGSRVSDEQVDQWARTATHVLFRAISYHGYVIWTAPGAEPPKL